MNSLYAFICLDFELVYGFISIWIQMNKFIVPKLNSCLWIHKYESLMKIKDNSIFWIHGIEFRNKNGYQLFFIKSLLRFLVWIHLWSEFGLVYEALRCSSLPSAKTPVSPTVQSKFSCYGGARVLPPPLQDQWG